DQFDSSIARLTETSGDLISVDVRQADINQHDLRPMPPTDLDSIRSSGSLQDLVTGQAQGDTQHFSCISVVFDHEDPARTQRWRRLGIGVRLNGLAGERQTNDEFTTRAGSITVRANFAAVQIDQPLHQRQPYAETSFGTSQRRVHLCEEVEN